MKNKEKIIGSIVILCISIVFIIVGFTISNSKENINDSNYEDMFVETDKPYEKKDEALVISAETDIIEHINIKVDIKGAVKAPGVYEVKKGSRVADLIKLAGGVTTDAELDATNLSKKLNDEDCIVIYRKGEKDRIESVQNQNSNDSTNLSSSPDKSELININTAKKEQLNTLTGIGDIKADAIIKYREENGGFKSIDELIKVDGIGEKTLSKFIDKVDIK